MARISWEHDDRLVAAVDAAGAEAARRAGPLLPCRLGCTECCHGPFPIDALDAHRLARGLQQLEREDPARAAAVIARAQEAVAILGAGFPGDPATGDLTTGDSPALEEFLTHHASLPCPALDPATGGCELYRHRPLACRTYGPPVVLGEERLEPCRLCFVGADAATIEACRVTPDLSAEPGAFEDLAAAGFDPDTETLVAFALVR